ncbi:hypothetical protein TNCV_1244261 [Trichonephila clavipes]|nr:hypothetical protein TNCV_1244261 [Trichonephila clavipes]
MLPVLGKKAVLEWCMKEVNKFTVQIISLQISEIENNSASHVDKLTLYCLRHFHKINELPSKTTPPENDFPFSAFLTSI